MVASAAVEAAAEEATEEAAVELEEPPHAVIAAAAPTTAEAFRKSRREIIFIIVFSFNSYFSIFTGAIFHAPVIPVRIIPLFRPSVQENKFTRLEEMFCDVFTNDFCRRRFLFSKYHNFSCFCNQRINWKRMCYFLSKRLQNVASSRKALLLNLYILKNIFRDNSLPRILRALFLFRKHFFTQKGLLHVVSRSSPSGSVLFYRCSSIFAILK